MPANDYRSLSRFFFTSYQRIEDAINTGEVNAWDIVLCSDTKEMLLVNDQFELIPILSKVYRFTSIAQAENYLNHASDSYQGQLVSILDTSSGTFKAYVVNKTGAGVFYVTAISIYNSSDIDYNEINHRPIEQLSGNIESPVILSNLNDGLYKVTGAYKVSPGLITIFQSDGNHVISVAHDNNNRVSIKVITDTSIADFLVSGNEVLSRNEYATKNWIESQGYLTNVDFDQRIQALDIMTRNEAVAYIQEVLQEGVEGLVNNLFDTTFNTRFDIRFGETLQEEDNANVINLFN